MVGWICSITISVKVFFIHVIPADAGIQGKIEYGFLLLQE